MKYFILVIGLVIIIHNAFSQGKLQFEKEEHDFGDISEEDGPVEYSFGFINSGDQPIQILKVNASCGCTTSGWTKEIVMPGDSGFVKAKYNPRNRPGKFNKSLKLTTNEAALSKVLYISGYVKPKPKTPEEEFPIEIGRLRFKTRYINYGKITTQKPWIKEIEVYNPQDTTVHIDFKSWNVPEHIEVSAGVDAIMPKGHGLVQIVYNAEVKNDYGYVNDLIEVADGDGLSVLATIEEYFPELSPEELDGAPKLNIIERSHDFGEVEEGDKIELEFLLENSGQEKLSFRKIKSNCDCLTYEPFKKSIKKGKSEVLKAKLDTAGLRGNQYKTLSFFTNDPVSPTQIITIRGKVEGED